MDADVIVVGAGLAGLVATAELADAGRRVLVVDQETASNLGGQAFWSFGGLFFVDSPEQRRMGIKDSLDLAWQDWLGSAGFDRLTTRTTGPRRGREAYVDFAAGEKRSWLHEQGMRWFPVVGLGRARRRHARPGTATPCPASTSPGAPAPASWRRSSRRVREARRRGPASSFGFRHRVDELTVDGGAVDGVRGTVLAPTTPSAADPPARRRRLRADAPRRSSSPAAASAPTTTWSARNWPRPARHRPRAHAHRRPRPRRRPDARASPRPRAARLVNRDRMWHYVEGIQNWDPIWPSHAIRILPGPSSLWFDGNGDRLPAPLFPGLRHPRDAGPLLRRPATTTAGSSSPRRSSSKEFALSGSEQNPDLTGKSVKAVLGRSPGPHPARSRRSSDHGADFVVGRHARASWSPG